MTSQQIEELKETNYVRIARPENNYWVDFFKQKLYSSYIEKFGDKFNIIIYNQTNIGNDFYVIPFSVLKTHLIDKYLSHDTEGTRSERWVLNIKDHRLKVTNCSDTIDVKEYFSNPYFTSNYDKQEENDYEIENKKQEINARIKQSRFRKKVLGNFSFKCCISGIKEEDLLVASHIIPWKDRTTSRLDPTNGLCLFITYDKLFDKGYFTLTDDYKIIIVGNLAKYSQDLQQILNGIDGKHITSPIKQINKEYIEYHRTKIFIDREEE